MSIWFMRQGCDGNYQGIIGNGYYLHGSWEVRMGREDSCTMLGGGVVSTSNSDDGKTWDHVSLSAAIDQWHHVLMIYDGAPKNNANCVPWNYIGRVMKDASEFANAEWCTAITETYTWDPWCGTSTLPCGVDDRPTCNAVVPGQDGPDVPAGAGLYDGWQYCTAPGLHYYLDGVNSGDVDGANSDSGPLARKENNLRIGKAGPGHDREYFTGLVDQVRIYTRQISHHEGHALFTCEGGSNIACETMGTSGATVDDGSPCMFPFTHGGKTYNHCTDDPVPGWPEVRLLHMYTCTMHHPTQQFTFAACRTTTRGFGVPPRVSAMPRRAVRQRAPTRASGPTASTA